MAIGAEAAERRSVKDKDNVKTIIIIIISAAVLGTAPSAAAAAATAIVGGLAKKTACGIPSCFLVPRSPISCGMLCDVGCGFVI